MSIVRKAGHGLERIRRVAEAVKILGPIEQDEPTDEQFEAYRRWSEKQEFGVATSQSIYEEAIFALRTRARTTRGGTA